MMFCDSKSDAIRLMMTLSDTDISRLFAIVNGTPE